MMANANQVVKLVQETFNADVLVGFFSHQTGEETTRLKTVAALMKQCDMSTFKTVCKDSAKQAPEYKTRISEMRQIYGCLRFVDGFKIESGYKDTVINARKLLKEAHLTWDGSEPRTEEQVHEDKTARLKGKAAKNVNSSFNWKQPNAMELYAEAIAAEFSNLLQAESDATEKAMIDKVMKAADAIMEIGSEYAKALCIELSKRVEVTPAQWVEEAETE